MQLIYETLRGLGLTSKYQGYQHLRRRQKLYWSMKILC